MELESHFLSEAGGQIEAGKSHLPIMFKQVIQDLNVDKMCTLTEGTTTTHLKLTRLVQDPEPVLDHQVPVFLEDQSSFQAEQWDLTTNQVLPYIDGFNHVSRIAAEADVDINLVKACVQNLVWVLSTLIYYRFYIYCLESYCGSVVSNLLQDLTPIFFILETIVTPNTFKTSL
uniref:Uncharacterized protein n=2 Tax=Timema TaxID=61471 RepID=A0A7R9EN98_9NEOP|nr:unnamed protein product [Timema monikensis]